MRGLKSVVTGVGRNIKVMADEIDDSLFVQRPGHVWYVDTVNGSDTRSAGDNGQSWLHPFVTMAEALSHVGDNDIICVLGNVREHVTAPLGVQGVRIVGASGGRNRHDDGVRWREAAVVGDAPLITIREQGWEFHHILFVPETGYSAIRNRRQEDASYPDGSHFIVHDCKFIGNALPGSFGGIGIEDYGGGHHWLVDDCEFHELVSAIVGTNVGVAAPLRFVIRNNRFEDNQNDIRLNGSRGVVQNNLFQTPYHVTNHPVTINLQYTADPATGNFVVDNTFSDTAANVVISKGYKASTGDVWRNRVTNTAADIVTVPSA